jgi:glutathione S-transferase
MSVVLYGEPQWYSPYVFSAFVALREKGVAFDVAMIRLHEGEQRLASYEGPSITGRVPAISHDGFWLAESSAIAEYVDEAFPGPRLFPTDLRDRARARQIMAFIRSDLMALREERSTATMFFARATAPLSVAGEAAAAKLIRVADRLVHDGSSTLFGEWCLADADLAFMLHRLILNAHPIPAKLLSYATANFARPSIREFMDHPRQEMPAY